MPPKDKGRAETHVRETPVPEIETFELEVTDSMPTRVKKAIKMFNLAWAIVRLWGYEMPFCAGDMILLMCHPNEDVRVWAELYWTNTMKTIARLRRSDVIHTYDWNKKRDCYLRPHDRVSYPLNLQELLVDDDGSSAGEILRLLPHGYWSLEQACLYDKGPVDISEDMAKKFYLLLRATAPNEIAHPKLGVCVKAIAPYESLRINDCFPIDGDHCLVKDNDYSVPACAGQGKCDIRTIMLLHMALNQQDVTKLSNNDVTPRYGLQLAKQFVARQKMSVGSMFWNAATIGDNRSWKQRQIDVWNKVAVRIENDRAFVKDMDISLWSEIKLTVPADPPTYSPPVEDP